MRLFFVTLLPAVLAATPALADGFACQANILSGQSQIKDYVTGQPVNYGLLPVAPSTGYYSINPTFDLTSVQPAGSRNPDTYLPIDTPFSDQYAGYVPPQPAVPYAPPPTPDEPVLSSLLLAENPLGIERLELTARTVRLIGSGTNFTFFDPLDRRPADGPLTASRGEGLVNGVSTQGISFSLGSGFNATGTQGVSAAFSNGLSLQTVVLRNPPGSGVPVPAPSGLLNGTSWQLSSLNGVGIQGAASLNFDQDGTGFGGRAQCNAYGGEATASDFGIAFSNIFSTRAACPLLSEEQAYFAALRSSGEFRLGREGDGLALLSEEGIELAAFRRATNEQSGTLTGQWRVSGVLSDGVFQTNLGPGTLSLNFGSDGQLSGQLGCSTVSGSFSQSGANLTIGAPALSTFPCLVGSAFDFTVSQSLPQIAGVRFGASDGSASLVSASGTELLRLTR